MDRRALVLFFTAASSLLTPACFDDSHEPEEGTWATASALKLAACSEIRNGDVTYYVTLSPHGTCLEDPTGANACFRYSSMQVSVNGVFLKQIDPGGDPSVGCSHPLFELRCPEQRVPMSTATCLSNEVLTETGTVDLTVRIDGEARTSRIDGFSMRRVMEVDADTLVLGRVASVDVGTRRDDTREKVSLFYEGSSQWTQWDLESLESDPWTGERIELPVPTTLPSGSGRLQLREDGPASIGACPFADCTATLKRWTSRTVSIVPPPR